MGSCPRRSPSAVARTSSSRSKACRSSGTMREQGQPPLVVERARLHPDERAVDELARLARAADELAVALGLAANLGDDAVARALHLLVEALRLALAAILADDVPQARDRERRDEAEREDEAGS